jgi:hypothetical protein
MHVDMTCGYCEGSLSLSSEEESAVWMLVHRFANAHVPCGFVTSIVTDYEEPEIKNKFLKKPDNKLDLPEPSEEDE